jgi:hypothetical protein
VSGKYVEGRFVPDKQETSLHITVKKALATHKRKALIEIYREIMQTDKKGVFHPRDPRTLTRKQLKSVIRSSIFLKEKYLPSGEFEKLKARLVAGGNMQDKSLYEDISSPTVATAAVFAVAAIAAQEHRNVDWTSEVPTSTPQ